MFSRPIIRKEIHMEENKEIKANAEEKAESPEEKKKRIEELKTTMELQLAERKRKSKEANEAMSAGKGRLELETPILAGDDEIKELAYDFTVLTGIEYTDAMDSDPNAQQIYRITDRQALALFARAAAKQTEKVDSRDIIERMGMTDAVVAVQLATLFFSASTRAGHLRISKR